MKKQNLAKQNTALIVIDIQERFLPVIKNINKLIKNTIKLVKSFQLMNIPLIVTEQYSKGLGKTDKRIIKELKSYKPIEKISFNCFDEKKFKIDKKIKNLVICGIESHVCVIQTVLAALEKGFNVYLVKDAVSSRKLSDYNIALERAKQEGVKLVSTEMVIFQLLKKAGTKEFKEISKIIK